MKRDIVRFLRSKNMTEATRRTIGEMSTDARILYDVLVSRMVKGSEDFVPYADLTKAIGGRNVQNRARGLLCTARKNVERDYNLLLESVRSEGVKKVQVLSGVVEGTVRHIGRMSRRTVSRVVNAAADRDMSNDERVEVGVQLSLLGAIQQFTRPKARKLLEGKVKANESKELPTADTIRLFAEKARLQPSSEVCAK